MNIKKVYACNTVQIYNNNPLKKSKGRGGDPPLINTYTKTETGLRYWKTDYQSYCNIDISTAILLEYWFIY